MIALDELAPDDEIRPFVERCTGIDDAELVNGRWVYTGCPNPAIDDGDGEPRCAEHSA